jgi:molybdenum cofactor cytidylyltransferase
LKQGFAARPDAVHIPTFQGERGHPTFFPWALASKVGQLPEGQGINSLRSLEDVASVLHPVEEPSVLWDLDTPADYQQVQQALGDQPA